MNWDKERETSCEEEIVTDTAAEESAAAQNEEAEAAPEMTETEKLTAELEESKAKILYLQADYQNYRRRMIKEVSDARMLGVSSALEPFLQVFDYLSMARDAAEKSDNIESIRQGVAMIINEYVKAFDELGVKKLEAAGKPFDPEWQEAVQQQPSDTVPEGVVISEWCPAYKLGEKILRAAKVVVSAGAVQAESDGSAD